MLGWQPITCTVFPEKVYVFKNILPVRKPTKPKDWIRIHKPDKDVLLSEAEGDVTQFILHEQSKPTGLDDRLVSSILSLNAVVEKAKGKK